MITSQCAPGRIKYLICLDLSNFVMIRRHRCPAHDQGRLVGSGANYLWIFFKTVWEIFKCRGVCTRVLRMTGNYLRVGNPGRGGRWSHQCFAHEAADARAGIRKDGTRKRFWCQTGGRQLLSQSI